MTRSITRFQFAELIVNLTEKVTGKEIVPAADSTFTDQAQVSTWALEGMGTLAANGIMAGTSATTLSPKNACTVEQSILLVYRVYEKYQSAT